MGVSRAPPFAITASDDTSAEPLFDGVGNRSGHRIADDLNGQNLLPLDRLHDLVGVESACVVGNTTVCPVVRAVMTAHCAAPCMSGGSVKILVPGFSATRLAISS